MREILFRAKDKDDGKWYEGYYLQLHDTTYCCMPSDNAEEANRLNKENEHHYIVFERMTDWGLPNKHLRAEILPETICQYTGLTDKNGRKIFDGDILHFVNHLNGNEWLCSVEFLEGSFICRYICKDGELGEYNHFTSWHEKVKWEVISNIFDNPELIGDQP